MNDYKDIINLPHHVSNKRVPMSFYNRAAQFAPFAALTGFSEALNEVSRSTNNKIELDNYSKYVISDKIQIIIDNIKSHPTVSILYYVPDNKKEGGSYQIINDKVKRVDDIYKIIYLYKASIKIDDILNIEL